MVRAINTSYSAPCNWILMLLFINICNQLTWCYLSITRSQFTAVDCTPSPHPPSPASGCGCSGCSGGPGPDEAERGSTAVLSLWLPLLPPHLLPLMNNGGEKYIYLLTSPAPWLRPFSLSQSAAAQGPGFWTGPPPCLHPLTASQCHPTHDCLCRFWSWALLSVLEMGNQAWFWKGQVGVFKGGRRRGGGHHQVQPRRAASWSVWELLSFHQTNSVLRLEFNRLKRIDEESVLFELDKDCVRQSSELTVSYNEERRVQ